MRHAANKLFDGGQFELLHGKQKYSTDLVGEELAIYVCWKAVGDVTVWLRYPEIVIPYQVGRSGEFTIHTKYCVEVIFETDKANTVCAVVKQKDLKRLDQLDYTPVEIHPPRPINMALTDMVAMETRKQLLAMGVDPDSGIDIEPDDLDEEDDGFGEGFMEPDDSDETISDTPKRKTARKRPKPPAKPADAETDTSLEAPTEPVDGGEGG